VRLTPIEEMVRFYDDTAIAIYWKSPEAIRYALWLTR
jgi:hypothetical protein